MPSSFRIWGVVLPMVISHALLVLGTVTLICAMLPILLTPLLPLPRCGAYTWLWRSMRSMCVFCAVVTLTTSAWMLIMIAALDSPYPSDVQVAKRQLISFGPLGPAWVIGVVFTSPRNRQRIHLISVQWFQGGPSALHVAPPARWPPQPRCLPRTKVRIPPCRGSMRRADVLNPLNTARLCLTTSGASCWEAACWALGQRQTCVTGSRKAPLPELTKG